MCVGFLSQALKIIGIIGLVIRKVWGVYKSSLKREGKLVSRAWGECTYLRQVLKTKNRKLTIVLIRKV